MNFPFLRRRSNTGAIPPVITGQTSAPTVASPPIRQQPQNMTPAGPSPHRVPWKVQVAIICFVFAVFVSLYSIGSLWNYVESLQSRHEFMLKLGLIAIDVALFWFIGWKLWAHYAGTRVYCFVAHVLLGLAMIIHAGAVNQMESSKIENQSLVKSVSDGTAANLREAVRGKVEAGTAGAMEANARGQRKTASRITSSVQSAGIGELEKANQQVMEFAEKRQAEVKSFLPDWYMRHAMWALLGVAFTLVMGGVAVGQWGAYRERDGNGNGVPDWMERMPPQWLMANHPQHYAMIHGSPMTTSAPTLAQAPPMTGPVYAQLPNGQWVLVDLSQQPARQAGFVTQEPQPPKP